jgi:hypothetical protein
MEQEHVETAWNPAQQRASVSGFELVQEDLQTAAR